MSPLNKIKTLALSSALLLAAACGDSSGPNTNGALTQHQDPACDGMNLLREMSFSGRFLYRMVACLSSSQQKLPQLAQLQAELGEDGMQALIDLLSLEHPDSASLGIRYPYLVMLATMMDRGTYDLLGRRLAEDDRRFQVLQEFLQEIKPRQAARLILDWHQSGQLHELLRAWLNLFEQLPAGTVAGLVRLGLSDQDFQQALLLSAESILNEAKLTEPLSGILGAKPFVLAGDSEPTGESLNAYEHWLAFWQQRDPSEQNHIVKLLANAISGFESQTEARLEHYLSSLTGIFKSWVLQSANPTEQLTQVLRPILDLSLDDLNPLMLGLEEIAQNPLYVDTLQEKLGSSKLHQELTRFVESGGRIQSCQDQEFLGLSDAKNLSAQQEITLLILNPSPSCGGLSPLLALGLDLLNLSCDRACQRQSELWLSNLRLGEPSSEDWNRLIDYSIQRLKLELDHDPYFLQHRRLAYGPVSDLELARLLQLRPKKNSSMSSLLSWEQALRNDPQLLGIFAEDFIESWLSEIIFSLESASHQLAEVFPSSKEGPSQWLMAQHDERLLRSFLGFYEGGPARSWLQNLSRKSMPLSGENPRLQAQLRQNLEATQGMFKNPDVSFQAEVEGFELNWSGAQGNQTSVSPTGIIEEERQFIELADLIETSAGAGQLALWQRLERQLPLIETAENRSSLAQLRRSITELADFAREQAIPQASGPNLPPDLFEAEPLNTAQARLLLLFFGQNFYPWLISEAEQIASLDINPLPTQNELSREQAPRVFAGAASTASPKRSWSASVQWLPELWGSQHNWQSWLNSVSGEPDAIEELFFERSQAPLAVSLGQLSRNPIDHISEHEKVLGLTGALSFIYSSRSEQYLAPSLGFADYCPVRNIAGHWQPGPCPFQVSSFADYQSWLQNRIRSQICPVLSSVREDSQALWLETLGFNRHWGEICPMGPTAGEGDYFTRILEDFWRLGINPRLKPEIASLPLLIRISKLEQESNARFSRHELDRIRLSLSPKLSATLSQREESYGLFRQRHPGLVSTIIQQLEGLVGSRMLTESLIQFGNEFDTSSGIHPIDRLLLDIVDEFQISRANNLDLLGFSHQLIQRLAQNPRDFEILATLIGDPYAIDTGILLGFTVGQAIEADIFPEFDPNHPGYLWALTLIQADNWQATTRFAKVVQDDLAQLGPYLAREFARFEGAEQVSQDLGALLGFYLRLLSSMNEAHDIDHKLQQIAAHRLPQGSWSAFSKILWRSLYQPLADLNNEWQAPLAHQSSQLSRLLLGDLPALASLQQRTSTKNSQARAIWGLIQGLRAGTDASSEAFSLLQDARLGWRQPELWSWLIREPSAFAKLEAVLDHVHKLSANDLQAANDELGDLVESSHRFLNFAAQNTIWQEGYELDFAYGLDSLGRMASSKERRDQSFELFSRWLEADSSEQQ